MSCWFRVNGNIYLYMTSLASLGLHVLDYEVVCGMYGVWRNRNLPVCAGNVLRVVLLMWVLES